MNGRPGSPAAAPRASFLWRWAPAFVMMAAIFGVSGMSDVPPLPGDASDKTGHFLAYAVLGTLVLRATSRARWAGVSIRSAMLALAISAAYGASDEFHQRFVPGRTAAIDDWVADVAGAACAIGLLLIAARVWRARNRAV